MWTHRQQRNAIGRVVTCHLTEGERYYLRLLLMNIRAPKSYEDLLTFNGEYCSTFRESVEKRGLILCDNNLIECMSEATSYQMPSSLRYLFDVLLAYCYPNNPEELWIKIENPMSEDFNKYPGLFSREISSKVLNHINDILYLMGHSLNILFKVVYPNIYIYIYIYIYIFASNISFNTSHVILTTKNDFVDEINDMLIMQSPSNPKVYIDTDETLDPKDRSEYEDFMHTLNPPRLSSYKLSLKKHCPIILLKNLNSSVSLCNGTRLTCDDFKSHIISATIFNGDFKDTHVFISRILSLTSQDEKIPFQFKRHKRSNIRFCWNLSKRTYFFSMTSYMLHYQELKVLTVLKY
ncbi:hypothetical protein H5410_040755 [Solanum commersonii]|uniref:DNA helicase Pif1-like 2B domain-containing protein n=1 Tax=Solanum commersonii TaxID=4109 RepID=A0A9J5XPV2_SOLCO|nr:hypothetical protein H5410_040755 [Solanum commersonii]